MNAAYSLTFDLSSFSGGPRTMSRLAGVTTFGAISTFSSLPVYTGSVDPLAISLPVSRFTPMATT